ncbi:hypothetical protein HJFPF1_05269 [Paramyrothecium foliicola]|nr:hypothetical protein HJFPF1_05269 [Paramyrothecium foliicola]
MTTGPRQGQMQLEGNASDAWALSSPTTCPLLLNHEESTSSSHRPLAFNQGQNSWHIVGGCLMTTIDSIFEPAPVALEAAGACMITEASDHADEDTHAMAESGSGRALVPSA